MLSRLHPSPAMIVACLALVVAVGGSAYAAVTGFVGPHGTIHGCVTKRGHLTLVKPGQSCTIGSPISWNQKGRPGTNGSTIVARARGHSSHKTSTTETEYPLSGNSWIQGARQLDQLVGEFSFMPPRDCHTAAGGLGTLHVAVNVDNLEIGEGDSLGGSPGYLHFFHPVFETGTARHRKVTVDAHDTCRGGGHFTITGVFIDVLGFR